MPPSPATWSKIIWFEMAPAFKFLLSLSVFESGVGSVTVASESNDEEDDEDSGRGIDY